MAVNPSYTTDTGPAQKSQRKNAMLAAGTISKRCQEISGPVIAARIVTNIHTAKICQRVSGCLDQPRG
jgi:hypothetical protein